MMLFADLGVNYKRDAEIYHITQLESGLHQNGGWFHFIGSIVKQPIGPLVSITLSLTLCPDRALAAKAFENQPLVQIEVTEIPWALSEKEID